MPSVLVFDYGIARPHRLLDAFKRAGVDASLSSNVHDFKHAKVVVLPDADDDDRALQKGVHPDVMKAVRHHLEEKRPLLAIGLALHLLGEGHTHEKMPSGLEIFRARVTAFDPRMADENERPLKSPHVGYGFVVGLDRHPTLRDVVPEGQPGAWFYFRHRLCTSARVPFADVAVAHHGVPFAGAIWKNDIVALQFLPEMSGPIGVALLKAWAKSLEPSVVEEAS